MHPSPLISLFKPSIKFVHFPVGPVLPPSPPLPPLPSLPPLPHPDVAVVFVSGCTGAVGLSQSHAGFTGFAVVSQVFTGTVLQVS